MKSSFVSGSPAVCIALKENNYTEDLFAKTKIVNAQTKKNHEILTETTNLNSEAEITQDGIEREALASEIFADDMQRGTTTSAEDQCHSIKSH